MEGSNLRNLAQTGDLPLAGSKWPARQRRVALYLLTYLTDILAMVGGFLVASIYQFSSFESQTAFNVLYLSIPIFTMFLIGWEAHNEQVLERLETSWTRALSSLFATALMTLVLFFFLKMSADLSRVRYALFLVSTGGLLLVGRYAMHKLGKFLLGNEVYSRVVILDEVGDPGEPGPVIDLAKAGLALNLADPSSLNAIASLVEPYDGIVVFCPDAKLQQWATFLKGSEVGGEIVVDSARTAGAVSIGQFGRHPTLVLSIGPLSPGQRAQKRAFDVIIASILTIALSPLLLLAAIAIRLESPGSALFRQVRVGRNNQHFEIFKFRTMRRELTDGNGTQSTKRDDERITRVGKILRSTSIDELPQLFNVLKGDMSLVGPRPHALGSQAEEALFWEVSERYWMRHSLTPGMTGLAQVRGHRGPTDNRADLVDRLDADLEYAGNWSLLYDLVIILATIRVLIHHRAY